MPRNLAAVRPAPAILAVFDNDLGVSIATRYTCPTVRNGTNNNLFSDGDNDGQEILRPKEATQIVRDKGWVRSRLSMCLHDTKEAIGSVEKWQQRLEYQIVNRCCMVPEAGREPAAHGWCYANPRCQRSSIRHARLGVGRV
jgi:hypothetical protein